MRNSADVKDKNIMLEGLKYRAHVHFYNGRVIDCGLFEGLPEAQKVLNRYPRDVWCGYDKDDARYREADEYAKRNHQNGKAVRRKRGPLHLFGRELVGSVPGRA